MLLIFPTQGLDAASALYREYAKSILSATADREKLFDSPGFRGERKKNGRNYNNTISLLQLHKTWEYHYMIDISKYLNI